MIQHFDQVVLFADDLAFNERRRFQPVGHGLPARFQLLLGLGAQPFGFGLYFREPGGDALRAVDHLGIGVGKALMENRFVR